MESHKRPASRSPPPWQRQNYPPPPSTKSPSASLIAARPDDLKSDAQLKAIPAPAYIDIGTVKTERDPAETPHHIQPPSTSSTPAPSLTSSNNMYQLGPPPPYSSTYPTPPVAAPTTAPSSQIGQTVPAPYHPPRRDSREEHNQEAPRQSLPSISEALKLSPIYGEQTQQLGQSVPPPPPFSHGAALTEQASRSPTIPRSYTDSHNPSSISSFSSQQSPRNGKPPDPAGARLYTSGVTESPRPAHQPYHSMAPSPTTAQPPRLSPTSAPPQHFSSTSLPPPPVTSYSRSSHIPTAGPPQPHPPITQPLHSVPSASVANPPYRSYQTGAGYSFPPPATSGLNYQESLAIGAAQQHGGWGINAEMEKVEEQRRAAAALHAKRGSIGTANYGLTVKRHLDDFDLENSLNEVAERTHQVLEFSRAYGLEAHKYPRSALPVSQLPPTDKVTEMINQSVAVTEALARLKTIVEGMNHAAAAAEEQARQQHHQDSVGKPAMYAQYGSEAQTHPGYGTHPGHDKLDGKGEIPAGGGFASGDAKKRRGRNAPPGRCHSCNRAETPEWRRGPDGARTLCNACGLHYAKLTRKMGTKPGQPGGSNLRPKENEDTAV